jgi:hypothetical protein
VYLFGKSNCPAHAAVTQPPRPGMDPSDTAWLSCPGLFPHQNMKPGGVRTAEPWVLPRLAILGHQLILSALTPVP